MRATDIRVNEFELPCAHAQDAVQKSHLVFWYTLPHNGIFFSVITGTVGKGKSFNGAPDMVTTI